jgi:hypothetical protein
LTVTVFIGFAICFAGTMLFLMVRDLAGGGDGAVFLGLVATVVFLTLDFAVVFAATLGVAFFATAVFDVLFSTFPFGDADEVALVAFRAGAFFVVRLARGFGRALFAATVRCFEFMAERPEVRRE